jgi:hypothetical protein
VIREGFRFSRALETLAACGDVSDVIGEFFLP